MQQAFADLNQAYNSLVQEHAYFTNTPPSALGVGNREARTWVTTTFPESGEPLKAELRQSLEAALGPERADLLWQQAQQLFREQFNDFGTRTRFQTVAVNSSDSLSYWDVSQLPSDRGFSAWLNTSGALNPLSVAEPLRAFVTDWQQRSASKGSNP